MFAVLPRGLCMCVKKSANQAKRAVQGESERNWPVLSVTLFLAGKQQGKEIPQHFGGFRHIPLLKATDLRAQAGTSSGSSCCSKTRMPREGASGFSCDARLSVERPQPAVLSYQDGQKGFQRPYCNHHKTRVGPLLEGNSASARPPKMPTGHGPANVEAECLHSFGNVQYSNLDLNLFVGSSFCHGRQGQRCTMQVSSFLRVPSFYLNENSQGTATCLFFRILPPPSAGKEGKTTKTKTTEQSSFRIPPPQKQQRKHNRATKFQDRPPPPKEKKKKKRTTTTNTFVFRILSPPKKNKKLYFQDPPPPKKKRRRKKGKGCSSATRQTRGALPLH